MSRKTLQPSKRFIWLFASVGLVAGLGIVGAASAQRPAYPAPAAPEALSVGPIRLFPVQGNVYMLTGAGGNIVLSIGTNGILFVDSGAAEMADQVLSAVRQFSRPLTRNPIRYIISTSADTDHVGGNVKIGAAGRTFTGGNVAGDIDDAAQGAAIIAHDNVVLRMTAPTGKPAPFPFAAVPNDSYTSEDMKLSEFFNGEGIRMIHTPAAHTDGDTMVHFTKSDVLATGDVFLTTNYPFIDIERGGSVNGVVNALNRTLNLAIDEFRMEGGTLIVPGHGRLCDVADVAYYRDMVTIIRDRVAIAMKKGMTLDQVKAAGLTKDYDGRWSAETGPSSTNTFVESVYNSLKLKK
jgi:cyclase